MMNANMIDRFLKSVVFFLVGILFVLVLVLLVSVAYAQDYNQGAYTRGNPEYFSDIQNPPDMIIYRDRGYGNRGRYWDRQPEYFSDIEQQPDLIIYPDRRRYFRY